MPEVCTCPDVATLERLVVGKVSPREADVLEEHLTRCERCQGCLSRLEVSDPLVERLRGSEGIAAQLPQGEVLEALMRRLRATPPAPTGPADETAGKSPSESETPTLEPAPDLTDLLGPPRGPGELGWLGTYRVIKVLGVGGMGLVFQAEDTQLQRPVALKVVKPSLASSASARERFRREARAAAALQHDHIVTIYQEGEDHGVTFLAMQLLEGESLETRLQREGRLPIAEVLRIGRETVEGLAAAHAKGLMHRDVKPANIWLESGSGRVKILDFGLARAIARDVNLTQLGVIAGTPQYMAPEQADGTALDARCDLFSLGCVLYRMATGEVAFPGATTMAILRAVDLTQPRPPQELNPEVPPALAELIVQLLGKKPSDRPASASAVAEALSAISTLPPGAAPPPVQKPKARSRRFAALKVASLLLVALGLAGYAFGPAIIRILTPEGTLVVEVDDPRVKVTIEGDGGLVITGAGPQEVRLRPGNYKVRASKDGKPVRPEELITITRGGTRVVRVSLEGEVATAKAVVKVAPGAFVLLNGKGVQVGRFDTLVEAVRTASDGDTIEIRGNGPFVSKPVNLQNNRLHIRAAEGFRPVIKLGPEGLQGDAPLLATYALLVLEGIEFQQLGQRKFKPRDTLHCVVLSGRRAPLYLANCRFHIEPGQACVIPASSSRFVARNCEFLNVGTYNPCIDYGYYSPKAQATLDNCLLLGTIGFAITPSREQPDLFDTSVALTRNTFLSKYAVRHARRAPTAAEAERLGKCIRLEAAANVFAAQFVFWFHESRGSDQQTSPLPPPEAEKLVVRFLEWRDRQNLYSSPESFTMWSSDAEGRAPMKRGPKTLTEWATFWKAAEADCLEGSVRFQGGGNLLTKLAAAPNKITPEDFRLRSDSAGYRAGKDGKDLGADVDLVGPGKAYERWKKTPAYQQWRKDTGQVK